MSNKRKADPALAEAYSTTVTFLEMHEDPRLRMVPPSSRLALLRLDSPPVHYYRYLYDTIGKEYLWIDRKRLSDAELKAILSNEDVELYVLHHNGAPAGFSELNFSGFPDVELVYFGLMPDFTGQGLGHYFLSQVISTAWARGPKRLHVQTCTLDHPAALPLYQKCGFVPFAQEKKIIEDVLAF